MNYSLQHIGDDKLDAKVGAEIASLIKKTTNGFKTALYREYVRGNYILAFAGTDDGSLNGDLFANLAQGLGNFSTQYDNAMKIGFELADGNVFTGDKLTITGHSLGGGLASGAVIASAGIYSAYTFNSAGLSVNSLYEDNDPDPSHQGGGHP